MTARFLIHEVEHYGDEQASLEDLHQAGCTGIEVLQRNHEGGEIRVECTLPDGVTLPSQLDLEFACL